MEQEEFNQRVVTYQQDGLHHYYFMSLDNSLVGAPMVAVAHWVAAAAGNTRDMHSRDPSLYTASVIFAYSAPTQ